MGTPHRVAAIAAHGLAPRMDGSRQRTAPPRGEDDPRLFHPGGLSKIITPFSLPCHIIYLLNPFDL